jgi:hypothetical protein
MATYALVLAWYLQARRIVPCAFVSTHWPCRQFTADPNLAAVIKHVFPFHDAECVTLLVSMLRSL